MLTRLPEISLRPVRIEDCHIIWEWANNFDIRQASFNENLIDWETHIKWFKNKLRDPHCYYWIGLNSDKKSVGQIRFDLDPKTHEAVVSISISPQFQGRKYGQVLLEEASDILFKKTSAVCIKAFVKLKNQRSAHVFKKAGFHEFSKAIINGCPSFIYMKSKQ
ncbi:hypothetical protein AWQ23_02220 [Picosynechococcus sp. PCC 73109]|nr:hypothetical protein AWQ23_02220 [Picosynechococcus sp. PCC 73109]